MSKNASLMEDAVKCRLFDQTIIEVLEAFADMPADKLENLINEAVASARRERRGNLAPRRWE
jgi:hypothetical protein